MKLKRLLFSLLLAIPSVSSLCAPVSERIGDVLQRITNNLAGWIGGQRMERLTFATLLISVIVSSSLRADDGEFVARQRRLLQIISRDQHNSLYRASAQLGLQDTIAGALADINAMAADRTTGGMFHGHLLMGTYLRFRSAFPDSLHRKTRNVFRERGLYRGDTENHWVTYYTGLYLAAQTWPDQDGAQWFNGRSSEENFRDAEGWLKHWMTITTTIGQGEFDSPTYLPVFLSPMLLLHDFAADPAMKKRATMMCDLLLADYAAEHLHGNYGGGHSRDYPADIANPLTALSTWISWLYFGEPRTEPWSSPDYEPRYRGSWESVFGALSSYRIPAIIVRMATDRTAPYIHRERKRVRNVIRFGDTLNPPAYKYTYMTAEYVLGSLHGGVLEPFQQHTWDVTYVSDRPYNTIFTVHPFHSGRQLGMFFPEELNVLAQDVDRYKLVYTNPDKWNSSSPYEQTFQHKNVVIVLYNIASGAQHPHIDGFFPKTLLDRRMDSTGWIFCRGGNTAVAFYPLKPYEWIEEEKNWRLRSHHLKNGVIVEVASVGGTAAYEGFTQGIRSLRVPTGQFDRVPAVTYTSLAGDTLTFYYDGPRLLNGKPVDVTATRLYDGPFMSADVGTGIIELRHGGRTRILDFPSAIITEQ